MVALQASVPEGLSPIAKPECVGMGVVEAWQDSEELSIVAAVGAVAAEGNWDTLVVVDAKAVADTEVFLESAFDWDIHLEGDKEVLLEEHPLRQVNHGVGRNDDELNYQDCHTVAVADSAEEDRACSMAESLEGVAMPLREISWLSYQNCKAYKRNKRSWQDGHKVTLDRSGIRQVTFKMQVTKDVRKQDEKLTRNF
jgi:hypothetical protein